jgi:transposase
LARENYSYKKYQKELARKKKAEEKRQKKLEKKAAEAALESGQSPDDQAVLE